MKKRTLIIAIDPISADAARSLIRFGILDKKDADQVFFLIVSKPDYFGASYLEHLDREPFASNLLTNARQMPAVLRPITDTTGPLVCEDPFRPRTREKLWPKRLGAKGKSLGTFVYRLQNRHDRFTMIRDFLEAHRVDQIILTHEVAGNDSYYFRLAALSLGLKTVLVPTKVPWIHGVEKHRMNGNAKRTGLIQHLFFKALLGKWVSRRRDKDFALRVSLEECVYLRFWQPQPRQPFANGTLPYDEVWLRSEEKLDAWKPVLHRKSNPIVVGHPHNLGYAAIIRSEDQRAAFIGNIAGYDRTRPTICIFIPAALSKYSNQFRSKPHDEIMTQYHLCLRHLQSQPVNVFICPHPRLSDEDLEEFLASGTPIIRDRATAFIPFLDGAIVDASSSLVDEMESIGTTLLIWDVYDNGGPLMTQPYLQWDENPSDAIADFLSRVLAAPTDKRPSSLESPLQKALDRFMP